MQDLKSMSWLIIVSGDFSPIDLKKRLPEYLHLGKYQAIVSNHCREAEKYRKQAFLKQSPNLVGDETLPWFGNFDASMASDVVQKRKPFNLKRLQR